MIEKYYHEGEGYNPFLIREGWQVAQLNYLSKHGLDDIDDVEMHAVTDEVFILFEGTAVLIAGCWEDERICFELVRMTPGVTYNIPAGVWHNIAMAPDAKIIIIEKSDTHLDDCAHLPLTDGQRAELYAAIGTLL